MKFVGGIWIPDAEQYLQAHLEETAGFADAYDDGLIAIARGLSRRRLAVDVGASFGLWSRKLAPHFDRVEAFEPLLESQECFAKNVTHGNVRLHRLALGDRNGETSIYQKPGTTFKTHVKDSRGSIQLRTLDSFQFEQVDFIKVDCEGFDYYVLLGAKETIARCKPVVIFEAKPKVSQKRYGVAQNAPHDLMVSFGYSEPRNDGRGNFICLPKEI